MKTVARTVENGRIHLYFHLMYVNSPDMNAKKEYHNRVSPIVLKGGLPKLVHNPVIKAASTTTEPAEKQIASILDGSLELFIAERTADTEDRITAAAANHMNISQVTIASEF